MTTVQSPGIAGASNEPARMAVTSARLIRWGGAASMLAGALTIVANLLHPPRSLATLAHDAQHTSWEVVHALAIVAFVVTAFATIALYAVQIERAGLVGLVGFVGTLAGLVLSEGLLVPDSLIFPALARDRDAVHLLSFPGPIIGNGPFTAYILISGAIYSLGTLLFFAASAQAAVLPRWGSLLIVIGILPLVFGALVRQGLDYAGAVAVGAGHLWLGYALWKRHPAA